MTAATHPAKAAASPDWDSALCAQTDPELFFPTGMGAQITTTAEKAKRICDRCPIRSGCLEWALGTGQTFGIWGGLDEAERRAMSRHRGQHGASYSRCIDEQEYIEQRVAEGASHRQIGTELGVGHSSVGKAWRFFEAERASTAGVGVQSS